MASYSLPGITQANFDQAAFTYLVKSPSTLFSCGFLCTVYTNGNTSVLFSVDGVNYFTYATPANINPGVAPAAGNWIAGGISGIKAIRLYPNAGTTLTRPLA